MKDKFGNEILVGDEVVYSVRSGDHAVLRYSIVNAVFPDKVQVRTQGGEGPLTYIRMPDRVVSLTHREWAARDG